MARFEQRITEEEVTAARRKIAAGTSLRSAAAEIPCAASTLSVRIKNAKAAGDARGRAGVRNDEHRPGQHAPEQPDLRAAAAGENALRGDVGPVEILRGALLATRANGQPDWPTRVSAARALAALRPDEVEREPEEAPPSTVVYDLPPGAEPVLHRHRKEPEGSADPAEVQPARHAGVWVREDTGELIAEYTPAGSDGANVVVTVHVLAGTPAKIDRDEAAIIDALSTGKELPALE